MDDVKREFALVQSSLADIATKLYMPPYVDCFTACEREEGVERDSNSVYSRLIVS